MFTGIIKELGEIVEISQSGGNRTFWIKSNLNDSIHPDESISHNGICLTVEQVGSGRYHTTAIAETLKKTNAGEWEAGQIINLEPAMKLGSLLDGHFVQGHVDTTGRCISVKNKEGSTEFTFRYPKKFASLMIEKGSICVNGVSLTAFDVTKKTFTVAIIPFTMEHTSFQFLKKGDLVNLEFDILGKYVQRMIKVHITK